MKNAIKIGLMLFFILVVVRSSNAQYSVTGTVRYSDNNELVGTGIVKAYLMDGTLAATTNIQSNGTYTFASLNTNQYDLIGFPNIEPTDNFLPTYYPNKIDPSTATITRPISNMTNVDITVIRLAPGGHIAFSTSISGNVTLENKSAENAIIYLKKGDSFAGYAITDFKGDYTIHNVPAGDYILVVYRMGSASSQKNVTVTNKGLANSNFSLSAIPPKKETVLITIPAVFSLSQNYPNPFNPSTVISYNIPVNGTISLVVFNSLGKEVKTLVNGFRSAGTYTVNFNASDAASGVYFYKLTVTDAVSSALFTDTKRMILIK